MEFYIIYGALTAFFIGLSIADRNALRDSKEELKQLTKLVKLNQENIKLNKLKIKLLELTKKEDELPTN